jgi:branched-chain amino acid transport system substrate-binding protein
MPRGLNEVMYEAIAQGDKDFSADQQDEAGRTSPQFIYFGGYQTEAGLIVGQAATRTEGAVYRRRRVSDPGVLEDWRRTLMTFPPDPRNVPAAKAVVDKFMAEGYNSEGYTPYTYAAIQAFAEAANKVDDLSKALKSTTVDTVVGPLRWDKRGDVTDPKYVFTSGRAVSTPRCDGSRMFAG